jgi:opacity protein-like surface antigen
MSTADTIANALWHPLIMTRRHIAGRAFILVSMQVAISHEGSTSLRMASASLAVVRLATTCSSGLRSSVWRSKALISAARSGRSAVCRLIRTGLSFDRSLIYATIGYALTEFEAPRFSGVNDGWRGGYLLGGGIEQAFAGGLSVKAEYNYVSSSGLEAKLPFGRTVESDGDHVLKVGLNYRF